MFLCQRGTKIEENKTFSCYKEKRVPLDGWMIKRKLKNRENSEETTSPVRKKAVKNLIETPLFWIDEPRDQSNLGKIMPIPRKNLKQSLFLLSCFLMSNTKEKKT